MLSKTIQNQLPNGVNQNMLIRNKILHITNLLVSI